MKVNTGLLAAGALLILLGTINLSLVNPQLIDSCESLTFQGGEWIVAGENVTLSVDSSSPYEGSGNIKAIANSSWNAMVVRRVTSFGAWWDLSNTPMLRFHVRTSDPSVPLYFHLVTAEGNDSWAVYRYEAYDNLITTNDWVTVEINLLSPISGTPDLRLVRQFTWWLNEEYATFKLYNYVWEIDAIEVGQIEGQTPPPTPLSVTVSPSTLTVAPSETATFTADASGGTETYSYSWYVNNELQPDETSPTFNYIPSATGTFTIKCVVSDGLDTAEDTATLFVQEPGSSTYTLIIEATEGGTTNPPPGNYTKPSGETVLITQTAESGYSFDHWEVNGEVYTTLNVTLTMNQNYVVKAVFVPFEIPSQPTEPAPPESQTPQIEMPPLSYIIIGIGSAAVIASVIIGKKHE